MSLAMIMIMMMIVMMIRRHSGSMSSATVPHGISASQRHLFEARRASWGQQATPEEDPIDFIYVKHIFVGAHRGAAFRTKIMGFLHLPTTFLKPTGRPGLLAPAPRPIFEAHRAAPLPHQNHGISASPSHIFEARRAAWTPRAPPAPHTMTHGEMQCCHFVNFINSRNATRISPDTLWEPPPARDLGEYAGEML